MFDDEVIEGDGNPTEPVEQVEDATTEKTSEVPEKVFTQAEFDERLATEFESKFNKRFAREWRQIEEAGLDKDTIKSLKPLAQRYGVTPKYLVQYIMNQLQQATPAEGTQSPPDPRLDRLDELLRERDLDKVRAEWKNDFGTEPTDEEIEDVEAFAREKNLSLEDAYLLATSSQRKDRLFKSAEDRVIKNLQKKQQGKTVPANAPKVNPTKKYGSVRDALQDIAKDLDFG